jgi:hypothetical protein
MKSQEITESYLIEDRIREVFAKDLPDEQDIRNSKMWLSRWKQLNDWHEDQIQLIKGISNEEMLGYIPPDEQY